MTDTVATIALVVYAASTALLAGSAAHSCWLRALFLRRRRAAAREEAAEAALPPPRDPPVVLVQLPVFNERDVVERLVEAAGRLRWPRDRFRVQLLDDSTDDAVAIGAAATRRLRADGIDAVLLHRFHRAGFKAGALAAGLDEDARHAGGPAEFVAIFDADFVPPPDFLERAVVPLLHDPRLALVQGRWDHINRDANVLTRAQALGIDAHFAVEQGARAWSGLPMNFNGTCGLWRRAAIVDAGGWEHDTLTEDLDLSYRAQLAGWRCTYRLGLAVQGEIPSTVSAWRSQQFRWAKGSIQTARKLLPRVWRSRWSPRVKLAATLHLTHYLVHPLILASLAAAPFAMPALHRLPPPLLAAGFGFFLLGAGSPLLVYVVAQFALRGRAAWQRLGDLPVLVGIGTGIAVSVTAAVSQALRGRPSGFERTPKQGDRAIASYRASSAPGLAEIACAAWAAIGVTLGITGERPWIGALLVAYGSGFAWVGARLLWERRRPAPRAAPRAAAAVSPARWLVPLGVASLIGYAVLAAQPGSWREQPGLFAGVGVALGLTYVAAVAAVRRAPGGVRTLGWIVVVAVGMRLLALGLAPSDDVNRYIVEGTQVRGGENPYLVAPAASALGHLVPASVRAGVNHADWTAIYPPATLGFEALVTSIGTGPAAFKIAILLAELVGLAAVLTLLARAALPTTWLLVAAWNPIGPLFGAGEAHLDFLTGALLVVSLLLATAGRTRGGLVTAALSALTKPFALVAVAAQAVGRGWRAWLVPALVALVAYAPFASSGSALFRSLSRFAGEMHFHGVLEPIVRQVAERVVDEGAVRSATVCVLAAVWLTASWIVGRRARAADAPPAAVTARLYAVLLLCVPTIHPWYMAPLVVLLPFAGSRALVLWTAMAPVYWLHGIGMQATGSWVETPWVTALAHAPALALLGWEVLATPGRVSRQRAVVEAQPA